MASQVRLLVGTRKAAFIYTSDEKRQRWDLSEPMLSGWTIHHAVADTRCDPPKLYAAAKHAVWGPSIARSTDWGKTWTQTTPGLKFPDDMNWKVDAVWNIKPGLPSEPGVVYAGTAPAGLFRSEDWGESWQSVESINRHENRQFWQPIAGGPTEGGPPLQSIEIDPRDPDHMYVAITGAYVTLDGRERWRLFSHRAVSGSLLAEAFVSQARSQVPPGIDPAAAHDMHKLIIDPKNPDRLWTQAHLGVFRSDDGGRSWEDVTDGLPSFHGFPITVTKREPDAAYVVPLETGTDNFRTSGGQFAVYRTRDAGHTWDRLTDGLPGPGNYQSVYREGMDTDGLDPEGVYVGTSNGMTYASLDGGDHWLTLPGMLPPILSVSCATV
jgi:photosystem II stability/assembly factor-like uncharacterized protein